MMTLSMPAPIQPVPIKTFVARLDGITAITRLWPAGTTAQCRLCDACSARNDACLLSTTEHVPDHAAASYGIRGIEA